MTARKLLRRLRHPVLLWRLGRLVREDERELGPVPPHVMARVEREWPDAR